MRGWLTLLASLFLLAPVSAKLNIYEAIKPLQLKEGKTYGTFCTAWATRINGVTYWITANHCVVFDKPVKMYLDKQEVHVLGANPDFDLAAISGPAVVGLNVAFGTPEARTPIYSVGFPFGQHTPLTVDGTIAQPHGDEGYELWDLALGPGGSGSPVIDAKHHVVVGVVQEMFCLGEAPTFCPIGRGASVEELQTFLLQLSAVEHAYSFDIREFR